MLEASLAAALGSRVARRARSGRRHQRGVRGRAGRRACGVRQVQRPRAQRHVRGGGARASRGWPRRRRCGSPPCWRRRAPTKLTPFLALELIRSAPSRAPNFDERLGRGLAALHRHGAKAFGLDHDNYVGRLPQKNTFGVAWPEFYRVRRLGPQLRAAADAGLAPRACGATSNGCSPSWRRCADRPSRPPGCTAICGAAT